MHRAADELLAFHTTLLARRDANAMAYIVKRHGSPHDFRTPGFVIDEGGCEASNNRCIRSHEVRMEGWEAEHDSRCYTVFSAPNYCDSTGNKGAYINIGPDYKLNFEKFDAVPHPDIKPMVSHRNHDSTCTDSFTDPQSGVC